MTDDCSLSGSHWSPKIAGDYSEAYPNTPPVPEAARARNSQFINIWNSLDSDKPLPGKWYQQRDSVTFVLVRGLYGNLLPGNFITVRQCLSDCGAHVLRPSIKAAGRVEQNAEYIGRQLRPLIEQDREFVFLCQSKGGLDTLHMLGEHAEIRRKTRGAILVQTPSGPSEVMQTILSDKSNTRDASLKMTMTLLGLRAGSEQLIRPAITEIAESLRGITFDFPILSVATWSIEATSWVDSFHRRLEKIRPGVAHDGQFYLHDQFWPDYEQLLLGGIDHAQSVMGGGGFDPARFWVCLLHLLAALVDERD